MLTKTLNPPLTTSNGVNTDHEVSSPNQDVLIRKKAKEGIYWVLDKVILSYNGLSSPVGSLEVSDGEKVILDVDITSNYESLDVFIPASPQNDLSIRLKAGGSGVIGKLNTICHQEAA